MENLKGAIMWPTEFKSIGILIGIGVILIALFTAADIIKNKVAQEEIPIQFASPPPNSILDPEQVNCLSQVIFHEARNQSQLGQRAVGTVVLNRAKQANKSICEITNSKNQFAPSKEIKDQQSWNISYTLAQYLMSEYHSKNFFDVTYGSTYFHTGKVRPVWSKKMEYVTQIEDHLFYREKP
jgi:spore germination cell wall hydrolase CwlJ-like protein